MFISILQVDDFYTYGNVDDLAKYLKKAQTLNTKLELCREKIEQVRNATCLIWNP